MDFNRSKDELENQYDSFLDRFRKDNNSLVKTALVVIASVAILAFVFAAGTS